MSREIGTGDLSRSAPRALGGSKFNVEGIGGLYTGRIPLLMTVLSERCRACSYIGFETGHCYRSRSRSFPVIENHRVAWAHQLHNTHKRGIVALIRKSSCSTKPKEQL